MISSWRCCEPTPQQGSTVKASEFNLQSVLEFRPELGKLLLGNDRMVLFRQEAMETLRALLVEHLGQRLTTALFAQFGYRCGRGDYLTITTEYEWETEGDRMASGPIMHAWEGIVQPIPEVIEFDRNAHHFHMKGLWKNSYEAEVFLRLFGRSERPVCHSLTGYASGWSSEFIGFPVLCIERRCIGCGDSECEWEIRPVEAWGEEADPWRQALSHDANTVARELERRVNERTLELTRANGQLKLAKEAAEQAAAVRSRFLATMSHEIRTPISAIISSTEILAQTEADHQQQELIHTIHECGESLLAVINDILDFSRGEEGELTLEYRPFEPAACIHSAVRQLRPLAHKKQLQLAVEVDQTHAFPTALGDDTRLRQVLINLIGNALKFTTEGEVRIILSGHPTTTEAGNPAHHLRYVVSDTGIGIPADRLDLVFESFRQVDSSISRRYGGTGLGLAICKRLVEQMGGRIWVESEVGVGSRFCFEFVAELAASDQVAGTQGDELSQLAERLPLQILLAEDNPTLRQLSVRQLERLGYLPDIAEDGTKVLERLKEAHYDVILMDMQMPDLDGLATTRAIRAQWTDDQRRPYIIAMTANALDSDRQACLAAGMDDYLSKPVRVVSLAHVLERSQVAQDVDEEPKAAGGQPGDLTFDEAELFELLDELGWEAVATLVLGYKEDATQLVSRLQQSVRAGDLKEIQKIAHMLGANSASFGAGKLWKLCQQLEHSSSLDGVDVLVAAAATELSLVIRALDTALAEQPAD